MSRTELISNKLGLFHEELLVVLTIAFPPDQGSTVLLCLEIAHLNVKTLVTLKDKVVLLGIVSESDWLGLDGNFATVPAQVLVSSQSLQFKRVAFDVNGSPFLVPATVAVPHLDLGAVSSLSARNVSRSLRGHVFQSPNGTFFWRETSWLFSLLLSDLLGGADFTIIHSLVGVLMGIRGTAPIPLRAVDIGTNTSGVAMSFTASAVLGGCKSATFLGSTGHSHRHDNQK